MSETKTVPVELLPCPFCGEDPDISTRMDEDLWSKNIVMWTLVSCANCDIGFEWPPGADAVAQWNNRAAAPNTVTESERMTDERLAEYVEAGDADMTSERGTLGLTIARPEGALQRAEAAEAKVEELEAFRKAVIGWRENDHPEWFCRKTAEYVAELGKGAERP